MIERLEHMGNLIHESGLPGESRADNVTPAHPNGTQLSRDRFLLLNSTLGFRGVDDNLSGLYEIRDGAYDGKLVNEGFIARTRDDWDPLNDGSAHVRQHGHFTAFGVPKGARVDGATPPHANVFAVKWRRVARMFGPDRTYLLWYVHEKYPELTDRSQAVEWLQFRLNEAGDDIEVIRPTGQLRQRGFEEGERFCDADAKWMNNPYVQPVPLNGDASEWIDFGYFDGSRIACIKYAYDPNAGAYAWVQTGPTIGGGLFEPSVARYGDSWIVAARPRHAAPIAWMRCDDPLTETPVVQWGPGPREQNRTPLSIYTCADGVLRLLTGDADASPHGMNRNPLYLWDVDPDHGFALSNQRVVFDTFAAGLPISMEHHPIVDMAKILPHAGGRVQVLTHRVRSAAMLNNDPDYGFRPITPGDMDSTAIYYARLHYAEDLPGAWSFE